MLRYVMLLKGISGMLLVKVTDRWKYTSHRIVAKTKCEYSKERCWLRHC